MRTQKAVQLLSHLKLDVLWVEDQVNLYYLTSLNMSAGKLLIHAGGMALFVDGRYYEMAKKKNPCPVIMQSDEALATFFRSLKKSEILVGFDSTTTTYSSYQKIKKDFEKMQGEIVLQLVPQNRPLHSLRMIKDQAELITMRKAADICYRGYQHALTFLKEGVVEKDIALEFEIFCRRHGAERMAFQPIVAFGENSAFAHYRAGDARLKKNDIVLMDLGVVVDKYCSDFTRTSFFGTPDHELKSIHDLVTKAHDRCLSLCKEGVRVGDLDIAARKIFADAGKEPLFIHSLGHGLGLDVHEFPLIRATSEDKDVHLKAGMVITIEPGLYLPGKGGVRYEDSLLITKSGFENFYV